MRSFNITTANHIGGRSEQQDSVGRWINQRACLVVVADGVGGSNGGRAASQEVIRCASEYWEKCGGIMEDPQEELTEIARLSNDAIHALSIGERRSPASTIVALYIDQSQAHWVHCGDSRLYWLRPKKGHTWKELARTRDHSVVQMLLEQNKITSGEMNDHPDKGRILKALGSSTFKGVDYATHEYSIGDVFLLCSDGYWESRASDQPILPPKPDSIADDVFINQLAHEAVKINGSDASDNTTLAIVTTLDGTQPEQKSHTSTQQTDAPVKGQTVKRLLMVMLYLFILFDIALIIYLFVLK